MKELSDLGEGNTYIFEVKVGEKGSGINKPLNTLAFPDQSFVAGISRGEDFILPTADNTIQLEMNLV